MPPVATLNDSQLEGEFECESLRVFHLPYVCSVCLWGAVSLPGHIHDNTRSEMRNEVNENRECFYIYRCNSRSLQQLWNQRTYVFPTLSCTCLIAVLWSAVACGRPLPADCTIDLKMAATVSSLMASAHKSGRTEAVEKSKEINNEVR